MMLRGRIDFVREREVPPTVSTWVMAAGTLILATSVAACVWLQKGVDESRATLHAQQALASERQGKDEQRKALALAQLSHLQDKRWKTALRQLNTPWFPVLGALEDAAVQPLYIMAMRLDPERGSLELELVAPQFDDALRMVDHLQHQPWVSTPRLVTREAPQGGTGTDSRFVMHAAWGVAHED